MTGYVTAVSFELSTPHGGSILPGAQEARPCAVHSLLQPSLDYFDLLCVHDDISHETGAFAVGKRTFGGEPARNLSKLS